mgnify:CR=1 FL=1|jgi:hypothetical protein
MINTKPAKNRYNSHDEPIINILILILCITPLLISFFLTTDGQTITYRIPFPLTKFGIPCWFKMITGYNCPTCGMTRCFVYLSNFNLNGALIMNPAGVLLYFFLLLQIPYRLLLITNIKIPKRFLLIKVGYCFLIIIGLIALLRFIKQFI